MKVGRRVQFETLDQSSARRLRRGIDKFVAFARLCVNSFTFFRKMADETSQLVRRYWRPKNAVLRLAAPRERGCPRRVRRAEKNLRTPLRVTPATGTTPAAPAAGAKAPVAATGDTVTIKMIGDDKVISSTSQRHDQSRPGREVREHHWRPTQRCVRSDNHSRLRQGSAERNMVGQLSSSRAVAHEPE